MPHKTERGVFELRQGRALCVADDERGACALVASVESLGPERLSQLRSLEAPLRLIVTSHRGAAMGIQPEDGATDLSLKLGTEETPESILALAMEQGTARATARLGARPATRAEATGLDLARVGHLLPALVSVEVHPGDARLRSWIQDGVILDVSCAEVESVLADAGADITEVAEAPVPLNVAEDSRVVFFREGSGLLEHVAVLVGARERWPDPVPVRLHSACLTGDLFGSMRCDCGEQLRGSLEYFKKRGGGVLVYLAQEGRGIGLGNKIRAYTLQESGLDTIDADGVLGFGADERLFESAIAILRHLGLHRIELLTNNPEKVRAVEEGGIEVVERTPLFGGINRHNLRYVQAKVHRAGHWLTDMIAQRASKD
jgi:GTP cyclohydrolase II